MGHREGQAGGSCSPYPGHENIYLLFTTRLVHLPCFQRVCSQAHRKSVLFSAFIYNLSVLCLYTLTHALTAISTNPATYLGKDKGEEGDIKPKSHRGPNGTRVEVQWLFSYCKDTASIPWDNENPLGFLCYRRPRQVCYLAP